MGITEKEIELWATTLIGEGMVRLGNRDHASAVESLRNAADLIEQHLVDKEDEDDENDNGTESGDEG